MTSLTLDKVPDPSFRFEVVPVPEFGQGEDGEPLTVNVYGLTALTKNILSRQTNDFVFDEAGELTTRPKVAKDSSCVIAALCSYDDDEKLVFGVDYEDAIARVESLPSQFREAVVRIAGVAVQMSGPLSGKLGVEQAKKNSQLAESGASSSD